MTQNVPPEDLPAPPRAAPAEPGMHAPTAVDTLKLAMRRARADDAERAGARAELRAARLGRLELLQDALQPLAAQIPAEVDMFDIALVPSPTPRLFIDMIGFVEMGRDGRLYILNQDTRHGRILVAESDSLDAMVDAVTDYVARRLLERDKALAAEARGRPAPHPASARPADSRPADQRQAESRPADQRQVRSRQVKSPSSPVPDRSPAAEPERAAPLRWVAIAFAFVIDLLGAIALFGLIFGAIAWAYSRLHAGV